MSFSEALAEMMDRRLSDECVCHYTRDGKTIKRCLYHDFAAQREVKS